MDMSRIARGLGWGFNLTFFPMHILGVGSHMRRIYNPTQHEFLEPLQSWNVLITVAAFGLALVQIPFVINFPWSLFRGRKAPVNPWTRISCRRAVLPFLA